MWNYSCKSFHAAYYENLVVTVHSHILVGRFHARMKICLHEYAKGAPFYEQKELQSSGKHRICDSYTRMFTKRTFYCMANGACEQEQFFTAPSRAQHHRHRTDQDAMIRQIEHHTIDRGDSCFQADIIHDIFPHHAVVGIRKSAAQQKR